MKIKLMNSIKTRIFAALALTAAMLPAFFILPVRETVPEYTELKDIVEERYGRFGSDCANRRIYDYAELKEEAHTIALVECLDDLTLENSHGVFQGGDRFHNAYSVRNVRAIKFFKNENNYPEEFQIAQGCALSERRGVVGVEGHYPMEKGGYYLVFLKTSMLSGRLPLPASASNGLFDLKYLKINSDHRQVCSQAVADLLMENSARSAAFPTARFLEAEAWMYPGWDDGYDELVESINWRTYSLDTPYTAQNMKLEIKYAEVDGEWLFMTPADGAIYR